MKATLAVLVTLAASTMALSDSGRTNSKSSRGFSRRDDIDDVWEELEDDDKIDENGYIVLTGDGIISYGAKPEIETGEDEGDAEEGEAPPELAREEVDDADDILEKFHELREETTDEPGKKKRRGIARRGEDEGAICTKNGDCDDDQPMCAFAEGVAGPGICMKLDD